MKRTLLGFALAAVTTLAACTETPLTPSDTPPSQTMTFRQGARFEYQSYNTDPTTDTRTDTSARRRVLTLVNAGATVQGRNPVAVYIDSLFSTAGGFVNVTDSVLLFQQPGTNDIWRYASMIPELDVSTQIPLIGGLDLGRQWHREVRLGSTVGIWVGGEVSTSVPNTFGIPLISTFTVRLSDSAVGSATENVTVGTTSYVTTRSTHHLRLSVSATVNPGNNIPSFPVEVAATTIKREIWVAPALGAIVKEHREGKVVNLSYQGEGFTIPIPGYHSEMTAVLSTGG